MKLKHPHAIILSGLLWMGAGIMLLSKGTKHLINALSGMENGSGQNFMLIKVFEKISGNPKTGMSALITVAFVLGFIKGRVVLKKSVERVVKRIRSLPSPISLSKIYGLKYYLLIGSMVFISLIFKILPLPVDIKGFIDFAIGIALVNGAMLYFRSAYL